MLFSEDKLVQQYLLSQNDGSLDESLILFTTSLLQHGWAKIELSDQSFSLIKEWEQVFSNVFEQSPEELCERGFYRSLDGVSVGYRGEKEKIMEINSKPDLSNSKEQIHVNQISSQIKGDREFIECRLQSDGLPNPNYNVLYYTEVVRNIYKVVSRIGFILLQLIAVTLGLDPSTFTDLTDLTYDRLDNCKDMNNSEGHQMGLSSSFLRICKYIGGIETVQNMLDHDKVASKFGSHTDTSFLTIGLTSSTPGLDLFDLVEKKWIEAEKNQPQHIVNVFIGEFLQVLTNHYVQACVHRVNDFSKEFTRISCPMIIRANNRKTLEYLNPKRYRHPHYNFLYEALDLPHKASKSLILANPPSFLILESEKPSDLLPTTYLGLKMKLVHSLLDKKRQKCFEQNESEEESNWTLSSFPITYMS